MVLSVFLFLCFQTSMSILTDEMVLNISFYDKWNSSYYGNRTKNGVWNHTIKGENISKAKNYSLWQSGANLTTPRPIYATTKKTTVSQTEPNLIMQLPTRGPPKVPNPNIMFTTYPKKKVKLAKCADTQVFDKNKNKCRHKLSSTGRKAIRRKVPSRKSKKKRKFSGFAFKIKMFRRQNLTCQDPQKYHTDEYTMPADDNSAVIIKKTGEVLMSEEYYINGTRTANGSQGIYVCRQRHNCSKEWLLLDEGEFSVLENKSILVKESRRAYDKSEYIWQNRSVLLCDNNSLEIDTWETEGDNCSKEWGLMESDEFTILTNQSIYVNASDTLYDPTQYTWENQSLFVCDSFNGDPDVDEAWSSEDEILSFLTIVCMSMSIIALAFVLVTYSLFSELRTTPGINLMNLSIAILLAQLLWLLGSGQTDNSMACTVIAVLLHYFFLVSFVWTSIIAFDTWRAFTAKGTRSMAYSKRKRVLHALRYMAVGWLSVMVYVSICVALDQSQTVAIGYGSRASCWITNFNAKWIFFATPLGMVVIVNMALFSMTVKAIKSSRNHAKMVDNQANKRVFGVYVRIASVMGFTWVFGFAAASGWVFLRYAYVILSSLQGIYIAIAFALNKRARRLYITFGKPKKSGSSDVNCGHGRTVETMAVSTEIVSRKGKTKVIIVKENH